MVKIYGRRHVVKECLECANKHHLTGKLFSFVYWKVVMDMETFVGTTKANNRKIQRDTDTKSHKKNTSNGLVCK